MAEEGEVPPQSSEQAPVQSSAQVQKKTAKPKQIRKKSADKKVNYVRPYPLYSLEKSLVIAKAIKEKNAGNPWASTQVAVALGIGEKSSSLDIMSRASSLYGLTSGTRASGTISLEKLGRDIVYAPTLEDEIVALQRSFLNVDIFSKVVEYYKGNNLPEITFLSNTLESVFSIPKEFHEEFRKIFLENCDFTHISSDWTGVAPATSGGYRQKSELPKPAVKSFSAGAKSEGKRCFVIMPFSERLSDRPKGFFDEVFDSLIKPAAESAGFDVSTANKDGSDVIQSTIISELMEADIVIADLTDHNPNVLFELGVRMAQELPVAIIKTDDTGGIFDVDNLLRVFEYSGNLWPSTIKMDVPRLEGHISATWENRKSNRSYISILKSKS
jgi:hypothetical protein